MERIVVLGGGFAGLWSAAGAYLFYRWLRNAALAAVESSICISAAALLGEVTHARHPL
jgi:NADH dehydrogenase FAD-containing subunit